MKRKASWAEYFLQLADWAGASPRRLGMLAALSAALLGAPSLWHGFLLDDHAHRFATHGFQGALSGLNLFSFATDPATLKPFIEQGPYPWWTNPDLRLAFFRPLSSALIYLDDALFGDVAALHHAHSLLWSAGFVLAGAAVLRRLLSGRLLTVAVCLFTFDEARWLPTAWLANRNALVAGALVLLSFALHLRWRQQGSLGAAVLSAAAFAMGLCGGEVALSGTGLFLAHALWVERRPRSLIPIALVGVPYVVFYKLNNMGAHGSGMYLDPADAPGAFLAAAPARLAALVGNLSLNIPIDLWLGTPKLMPVFVGLGALAALGLMWLVFKTRAVLSRDERRSFDLLGMGAAAALLPALATEPASRLTLLPGLGFAGVLAFVLRFLWRSRSVLRVYALVLIHVPLAALSWALNQSVSGRIGTMADQAIAQTELEPDRSDLRVVALTTGDMPTFLYVPMQWALRGAKLPARYWILSQTPKVHRLVRISEQALELEVVDGHFLEAPFEQLLRSPNFPFHSGDHVQLKDAWVDVLSVEDWAPKRIRMTLDRSLDADEVRVLVWRDGALRRLVLPAVGGAIDIPFEEGVAARAVRWW